MDLKSTHLFGVMNKCHTTRRPPMMQRQPDEQAKTSLDKWDGKKKGKAETKSPDTNKVRQA